MSFSGSLYSALASLLGNEEANELQTAANSPNVANATGVLAQANGGTGLTSFAAGTNFLSPTGSGAALTGIPLLLFSQTADVTVGNSTAETTLVGAGSGAATIAANYAAAGKTVQIFGAGYVSQSGSAPTIEFKLKFTGTGGATILDSTAISIDPNTSGVKTNQLCRLSVLLTFRTAGTVFAQGVFEKFDAAISVWVPIPLASTAAVAFTGTNAQPIDFTVQWGTQATANTITWTNFTVLALN